MPAFVQRPIAVTVVRHTINRLGYFRFSGDDESAYHGSSIDHLEAAVQWIAGKPVMETVSRDLRSGESDAVSDGSEPVVCLGATEQGGDFLFFMYRLLNPGERSLSSISASSRVGDAVPEAVSVGANRIAGIPLVYWFIPQHNLLASINLNGRLADHGHMSRWMKSFLMFHRPGVPRKTKVAADDERQLLIYADPSGDEGGGRVFPRMNVDTFSAEDASRFLMERRTQVQAVMFRGRMPEAHLTSKNLPGLLRTGRDLFPRDIGAKTATAVQLYMSVPVSDMTSTLAGRVAQYWLEHSQQIEVGVQLQNGQRLWFGKSPKIKRNIMVPFRNRSDDSLSVEELLAVLRRDLRAMVVVS